jgi:nanoRNase/pAp phosphatase (c-di-AMP/oligoRNAs hydrolase)
MDRSSSSSGNQRRSDKRRNRVVKQRSDNSNNKTSEEVGKLLDCRIPVDNQREAGKDYQPTEGEEPAIGIGKLMEESDKSLHTCNGNGKKDYCEEFSEIIQIALSKGPVQAALFTHSHPDPDAIGSLMGVQWLLRRHFNIESRLFYHGEISHPQNNALVNLLDPQLHRVNEDYNSEDYQLHILCDTVPKNAGTGDHKVEFDIVIDHHKDCYVNGYKGLMIHVKTGSCSSIVFQLMSHFCRSSNWLDEDNDQDIKVSTALIAGIYTDTENMMSDDSTELEFNAFQDLFPFRHSIFLKQIVFFKRPKSWVDLKSAACGGARIDEDGHAIVGLGIVPDKSRDIVADMADEMVSWAGVDIAICFSVVGGDRIVGSVRSLNPSVSVADLCKNFGGKHGSGGGKLGKGAYQYSLGGMSIDPDEDEDSQQKLWAVFKDKEIKRISRLLKM